MSSIFSSSFYSIYFTLIFLSMAQGTTFTLVNKCDYTVWPGILSNAGSSGLGSTGFQLQPGAAQTFQAQPPWSGRFWARTGCSFDPATGQGNCATGDCGSSQMECNGAGAAPPATLAEFTIRSGGDGGQDFYDVSLVDGYNLPVMVEARGGSGGCESTGCAADLNRACPRELRAGGGGQGCRSACEAFGSDEYCCSGAYGSPATCQPSVYSEMFKNACPRAYSYAYDDATSTFTCTGADYTITFCPSLTSKKSSRDSSTPTVAGNSNGIPSPTAAATDTADSTTSQPQDNYYLPNFVIAGGASHFDGNFNFIICVTIMMFSFYFQT